MALNELALLGLAWSLSVNPSDTDIQKFQALSTTEQIIVQDLVEQKDFLPEEIEILKAKGIPKGSGINRAPTSETSK